MKRIPFIALPLLLMITGSDCFASSLCVPSELRVTSLHGRVISTATSRGEGRLSNALIELRTQRFKRNGEFVETTVRRVVSDAYGNFDLGIVKKGKYFVYARWTVEEPITDFIFPIEMKAERPGSYSKPELVVTLGLSPGGCHGSMAKYGKQNTTD